MSARLRLFEAFGVELEYMIVDAKTLDVAPICDDLLRDVAGEYVSDIERGPIDWSNELALHVVELKTAQPARSLAPLPNQFQASINEINDRLTRRGCRLMPGAMHPWMNPDREMKLWPHDNSPIYEAFHRVFDCRGHGWANLQSVHLNLPFGDDAEFGALHAAIRVILPILPALAASSPVMDGRVTGLADSRLEVYRTNARRISLVTGQVIPEQAFTQAEYDQQILLPLYAEIAPHDPEGLLQDEFLNARGAIARFSRGAIEIRVLDVQETPAADCAIVALIAATLRRLVNEIWSDSASQRIMPTDVLARMLGDGIRDGAEMRIERGEYLKLFGAPAGEKLSAGDLWRRLANELVARGELDPMHAGPIDTILTEGNLSRRIARTLGPDPKRERLYEVYHELCDCLAVGRMFESSEP